MYKKLSQHILSWYYPLNHNYILRFDSFLGNRCRWTFCTCKCDYNLDILLIHLANFSALGKIIRGMQSQLIPYALWMAYWYLVNCTLLDVPIERQSRLVIGPHITAAQIVDRMARRLGCFSKRSVDKPSNTRHKSANHKEVFLSRLLHYPIAD